MIWFDFVRRKWIDAPEEKVEKHRCENVDICPRLCGESCEKAENKFKRRRGRYVPDELMRPEPVFAGGGSKIGMML